MRSRTRAKLFQQIVPGDARLTSGRGDEGGQHAQRGGFAGAVRAEKAKNFSFVHVQVDRLSQLRPSELCGLCPGVSEISFVDYVFQ